ncbi:hypothetical protein U9M48_022753 [Paspalum notatum var. saurae]|uniref:Uncharacterized protein n=1 Tax=Paspalum notatum var. saurae TaxID=547442 RepID=A0AAQ3TME4_PASNO
MVDWADCPPAHQATTTGPSLRCQWTHVIRHANRNCNRCGRAEGADRKSETASFLASRVLARAAPSDGAAAVREMDRLQRRNPSGRPHSTSLKPPRPPRGPTFQPPPASSSLPEPSSPDGRQRKKVRFVNEAGSHHIGGRQVVNIHEAAKNKLQVQDAKTAEYKFFKKLCQQSGHSSHSYKHSHQSSSQKVFKQKQGLCNVTVPRKLYVQGNTVRCDDLPSTPAKNEEVPGEKINVHSSHSEYEDKDTSKLSPRDCLRGIHVLTPIAQTSFDVTGISGNSDREAASELIFSEKRRKLLKIAAKTVSMGNAELLQRRSEFVGQILQRLGANKIMRKQEGSRRHRKMDCRQMVAIPKGHFDNLLDYKQSDPNLLTKLRRTGKISSSYASDDSCEFMALPWRYYQGAPSFIDWKNDLFHGGSKSSECMTLPWMSVNDTLSFDRKRDIVHNQVSNLLLEDVDPCIHGIPTSVNELSLNIQTASYDRHGWGPMLPVTLPERMYFPCQNEEKHAAPYGISNTSWQSHLCSSLEQCIPSSVGLEIEDPKKAVSFGNSDVGLAELVVKPTISSILDSGNEILDHSSCLNSMSTPEHSYEIGAKSLLDSAFGASCLAGHKDKYCTEVELSDNSDRLIRLLDQLPVKFIPSSSSDIESRIWDHQSSYAEPSCKQDWSSVHDSSTELWSSVHQLQCHADLGTVLGFMPNGSAYKDLVEGHHSLRLVQGDPHNDVLGATDLSMFGSCSALDDIRETPMLSCDFIT